MLNRKVPNCLKCCYAGISAHRLMNVSTRCAISKAYWQRKVVIDVYKRQTTHYALRTIENISHANAFAIADPYRAATHNKGCLLYTSRGPTTST